MSDNNSKKNIQSKQSGSKQNSKQSGSEQSKSKTKSKSESNSKTKIQTSKIQVSGTNTTYTDDNVVVNATQKLDSWMKTNRVGYNNFITNLFSEYYGEHPNSKGKLFPHQQLVKNYLAGKFISPVRGLLVYHTLGSGKSRTAVTVLNALFYQKKIIVMTPASLKKNFQTEIMSFGLEVFRLENNWTFMKHNPQDPSFKEIAAKLNIPLKIIKKLDGFWYIEDKNRKLDSNYHKLTSDNQEQIKQQIQILMEQKIQFISYNGLNRKKLLEYESDKSFFDDALVIVDEIHNVIRSIINGSRIMTKFYELLMNTRNTKFVLLSATPIINKPSEISYILNLLHGTQYIISLSYSVKEKKTLVELEKTLNAIPYIDFYDLMPSTSKIDIKLVPSGFITNTKKGKGIQYLKKTEEQITTQQQLNEILSAVKDIIDVTYHKIEKRKIITDDVEEFDNIFIDYENLKVQNTDALARRMIGMISYYNVQDPKIFPTVEQIQYIESIMSDYQYTKYSSARDIERASEIKAKQSQGKELSDSQASYYKTLSRMVSDFCFPETIARPYPSTIRQLKSEMDLQAEEEDTVSKSYNKNNELELQLKTNNSTKNTKNTKKQEMEKLNELGVNEYYQQEIKRIMDELEQNRNKYLQLSAKTNNTNTDTLQKYSPKYVDLINNLNKYEGSHLIYSQFRNIEGLGVLKIALRANGYGILKVKGNVLDIPKEDLGKPLVVEFGDDREQNEILKSLYNNRPQEVNKSIVDELLKHYPKSSMENFNRDGQMIKIMMIGVSGTEGLSLRNTRYVHILESYFNNVRIQQIIGRAKRANSHEDLPEDQRFVKPFIYISKLAQSQLDQQDHGIVNQDNGETSDETILKIAQKKEIILNQVQEVIQSASIECNIQKSSFKQQDRICYKPISNSGLEDTLYKMNLIEDLKLKDVYIEQFKAQKLTLKNGIILYYNSQKNQLIDFYSYEKEQIINLVGFLKEGKLYIDTNREYVQQKIDNVIKSNKLIDVEIIEPQQKVSFKLNPKSQIISIPLVSFVYGVIKEK